MKSCKSFKLDRSHAVSVGKTSIKAYFSIYLVGLVWFARYCGKMYSRHLVFYGGLAHYMRHERTHTGVKTYTCKNWDKMCFTNSLNCKHHERTQTGVKPYICQYCKKCCTDSSDCKRHERNRTGKKLYTCKYRVKSFSDSSHCKKHERTHSGVKPYTSQYCVKSFTKSGIRLQETWTSALLTHRIASDINELTQERSRIHVSIAKSALII